MTWDDLTYWNSGEWQVVEERLDECITECNPNRVDLFNALKVCPLSNVKVAIMGQDPYPNLGDCTGIAFSIPSTRRPFPPTLSTIFTEYCSDLHLPRPKTGDLTPWCKQGVLLWNVIPSCKTGKSLSHDWEEWKFLTKEIVETITIKGCVCAFLGSKAHEFERYVNPCSRSHRWSHPSPRASNRSKHPFLGSRIFSTINASLVEMNLIPIDWQLP